MREQNGDAMEVKNIDKPDERRESPRALRTGFAGFMSGPLVRSSYRAGRLYREAMARRRPRGGPGAGMDGFDRTGADGR